MTRDFMAENIFEGQPLALIALDDLANELELLWKHCGTTQFPYPLPDDDEWEDILSIIPPSVEQILDAKGAWVRSTSERARMALGYRANRVWHFLSQDMGIHAVDGAPPRWALLPYEWRLRMIFCCGHCYLPFAWIGLCDTT